MIDNAVASCGSCALRARALSTGVVAAAFILAGWCGVANAQVVPAAAPPAAAVPATQPAQEIPEAALAAIEGGRYAEAATLLEPLAQLDSASFDLLAKLGGCYDQLTIQSADDRTLAGRENFTRYSELAVKYYLRASQLAVAAGDPRAEVLLRQVLKYAPRNPTALVTLGRMYEMGGNNLLALAQYREYIKTDAGKTDWDTQVALGRLLTDGGFYHEAVILLEKIRGTVGAEADQQLARAYLTARQKDPAMAAKAIEAADRAVNSPRRTPDSFLIRAGVYLSLTGESSGPHKALEDALAAAQLARNTLATNPDDDTTWQKFAGWRQGVAGVVDLLKAQARERRLTAADLVHLAELVAQVGEMSRLLSSYEAMLMLRVAAQAPDAPVELLVALAERQRDLGLATAAIQTAERILQHEPDNAVAQKIKATNGRPEAKTGV